MIFYINFMAFSSREVMEWKLGGIWSEDYKTKWKVFFLLISNYLIQCDKSTNWWCHFFMVNCWWWGEDRKAFKWIKVFGGKIWLMLKHLQGMTSFIITSYNFSKQIWPLTIYGISWIFAIKSITCSYFFFSCLFPALYSNMKDAKIQKRRN